MLKRCTIEDNERVLRVLTHPEIYGCITDDGSPDIKNFSVAELLENKLFYIFTYGDDVVFLLFPVNCITWDIHVNFLKSARGENARKATHRVLDYMFNHTPCQKIIAYIPSRYKNVYKFSKEFMHDEGYLRRSYLKNGTLYDQYILGLRREQWQRQR